MKVVLTERIDGLKLNKHTLVKFVLRMPKRKTFLGMYMNHVNIDKRINFSRFFVPLSRVHAKVIHVIRSRVHSLRKVPVSSSIVVVLH